MMVSVILRPFFGHKLSAALGIVPKQAGMVEGQYVSKNLAPSILYLRGGGLGGQQGRGEQAGGRTSDLLTDPNSIG